MDHTKSWSCSVSSPSGLRIGIDRNPLSPITQDNRGITTEEARLGRSRKSMSYTSRIHKFLHITRAVSPWPAQSLCRSRQQCTANHCKGAMAVDWCSFVFRIQSDSVCDCGSSRAAVLASSPMSMPTSHSQAGISRDRSWPCSIE